MLKIAVEVEIFVEHSPLHWLLLAVIEFIVLFIVRIPCLVFPGQFICGNKRCDTSESLRSWEVNFGYVEDGKKKNALVKLRM